MFIECIFVASSLCHTIKDKPVMALLSTDVVVKTLDVRQTLRDYNLAAGAGCSICSFHENNSTVRPLLAHPPQQQPDAVPQRDSDVAHIRLSRHMLSLAL